MGKVHGSLAQAGKVRSNTPKVPKMEKDNEIYFSHFLVNNMKVMNS